MVMTDQVGWRDWVSEQEMVELELEGSGHRDTFFLVPSVWAP